MVVYNTPKRLEIIGRQARKIYDQSVGDPFYGVHQYMVQIIPIYDKFM